MVRRRDSPTKESPMRAVVLRLCLLGTRIRATLSFHGHCTLEARSTTTT